MDPQAVPFARTYGSSLKIQDIFREFKQLNPLRSLNCFAGGWILLQDGVISTLATLTQNLCIRTLRAE